MIFIHKDAIEQELSALVSLAMDGEETIEDVHMALVDIEFRVSASRKMFEDRVNAKKKLLPLDASPDALDLARRLLLWNGPFMASDGRENSVLGKWAQMGRVQLDGDGWHLNSDTRAAWETDPRLAQEIGGEG